MSLYFNKITIGPSRQPRNGNCFWITYYLGKRSSVISIMRIYCTLCTVRMSLPLRNTLCIHESFITVLSFWETFGLLCLFVVSHNEIIVMTIICLFAFKSFLCSIFSFVCLMVPLCDMSWPSTFQGQKKCAFLFFILETCPLKWNLIEMFTVLQWTFKVAVARI